MHSFIRPYTRYADLKQDFRYIWRNAVEDAPASHPATKIPIPRAVAGVAWPFKSVEGLWCGLPAWGHRCRNRPGRHHHHRHRRRRGRTLPSDQCGRVLQRMSRTSCSAVSHGPAFRLIFAPWRAAISKNPPCQSGRFCLIGADTEQNRPTTHYISVAAGT